MASDRKTFPLLGWIARASCALILAALPLTSAYAGICPSASTCEFQLTTTQFTGVNIDIQVTVDNTGSTTVLTYDWISDNLSLTPLGIDQVAWNSLTLASSAPSGWALQNPNGPYQMDGFGSFSERYDNSASNDLSVQFTLAGLVTNFQDNSTGSEFAVHIRYSGGCSSYVGDGTITQGTNASCQSGILPFPAPEPAPLLLMAIGLLAVGVARRYF